MRLKSAAGGHEIAEVAVGEGEGNRDSGDDSVNSDFSVLHHLVWKGSEMLGNKRSWFLVKLSFNMRLEWVASTGFRPSNGTISGNPPV